LLRATALSLRRLEQIEIGTRFTTERGRQSREGNEKMSMKLKVLGLGLLAVLATSALAVVNASAEESGHFVSEATEHHLIIKGAENQSNHTLLFQRTVNGEFSGSPIKCTKATYHGTLTGADATTTDAVAVRPHYTECSTGGVAPHDVEIDVPVGCGTNVYVFTPNVSTKKATVHVECEITITHPNCTIKVPKQTLSGATYDTVEESGKHALTVTVTVPGITGHFEGGLCVFLGTTQTFDMNGAVTVWGENTDGDRVGITHTAP